MPVRKAQKAVKKEAPAKASSGKYRAEDITVLEGLEPVRKRPGMYIGTTGPDGLHHLIVEVFDNSRDEAMQGYANDIEIVLLPEHRVRVADNGRGIPVDIHKQTRVSALETIMTKLHAGGKFGGGGYKVSGGLHGVGVSVVNALSIWARAEVYRDDGLYVQEYKQGKRKAAVKKVRSSKLTGSVITFEPDPEIFKDISFDWNKIVSHMRQQAYLVKGMRISIFDAREHKDKIDLDKAFYFRELGLEMPSVSFYFEGGLLSLVKFYNQHQKPIHKNIFYIEKTHQNGEATANKEVVVEVSLQYVDDISARFLAFANNTYNTEGGTHVTGFKTALTRSLNTYARKANLLKESEENFTGDDVLEGITAVVSIKMPEVQFEGQTKSKLGSVEARGAVETVFGEAFVDFLEEHPDDARAIVGKVVLALKARKAAKAAKDSVLRKGALEGLTLPGKLADCQSKDASISELFIVEGDSAGGCLAGDTKVALADGRELSFTELMKEYRQGKRNYCYTLDEEERVQVAPIRHPRVTRVGAEVVKVVLDNNDEIVCTPDHRFMLRDRSYKPAVQLTAGDSLMPLRRQISRLGGRITIKGYELVYSPGERRWIFTHLVGDRYNLRRGVYRKKQGDAIHHLDFNKRNNNPDNLTRMHRQEHLLYHTTHLEKTLHSEEVKQKAREAHRTVNYREKVRKIMTTPKMRKLLSERAKKQWGDAKYKEYMRQAFLAFYHSNGAYRLLNSTRLNEEQKKYWSDSGNRIRQAERVRMYFEKNPSKKQELSKSAHAQWSDDALRAWRCSKTKKQWTDGFRAVRKDSYNKTYLRKALQLLSDIYCEKGNIDYNEYDSIRRERKDKSIIKHETICERFFDGDRRSLETAVRNYNHRVKRVEKVNTTMDVYDLEVERTHNFALANGVFVHNSSKQGRDRRTQAILPLRGKILNVERARLDKMLASAEIKALVVALGTAIGDVFKLEKLRYHKIIIATDADVDGAHIRTLLLTLFYRYFRPVIEEGYLYIAQPPLYKIRRGKEVLYAYTESERVKIIGDDIDIKEQADEENQSEEESEEENPPAGREEKTKQTPKVSLQRYKGLGEMNADELWETTMDPEKRMLKQVTIEDAQEADKIFDILMGTDVSSRKSFIQSNAKAANLDI